MLKAVTAGLFYAAIVFAVGFALGTVRTLFVAPRVGEVAAVAIELPLMIGAAWRVSRRLVRAVPPPIAARVAMGGVAFVALMGLEFGVATLVFGQIPADFAARLLSPAGMLGLAGQIVFALLPLFVRPRRGGTEPVN
jgi:hypothetical protein